MLQRQETTRIYQALGPEPFQKETDREVKSTTYTVRPVHLVCGALACAAVTLALAGTAGYYFLRSDIQAEASQKRTELVMEYEDHIDRLRTEIERLSSRQMVDRETVEIQVMDVLRRQQDLSQRHAIVADLVARAESVGIYLNSDQPLPPAKPPLDAVASIGNDDPTAIGGESELIDEPVKALGLRDGSTNAVDPLSILQAPVTAETAAQKKTLKNKPL
ncbi:hypothetical protein GCM10009077_02730 [Roseibium denhamense]